MKIFDAHCDVLYKMFLDKQINFSNSQKLNVNLEGLMKSGVTVQCFAIYIPEATHPEMRFNVALYMVEQFYEKILKHHSRLKLITSLKELQDISDREIGAILTLEGCDSIGNDLLKLKTLIRLGVSSVGLTWNHANAVADGALEERGGGLTNFGKQVVKTLNDTNTWCDVSHLSEKGFWDVIEWADHPYASHSNSYSLCPHPRNLKDDQIVALIERNGAIGINFVPKFLSGKHDATITDILRHLEHICALGGESHVGFGSDFDGTDEFVTGLDHVESYITLAEELTKYYSDIQVEKFLYKNLASRFPRN